MSSEQEIIDELNRSGVKGMNEGDIINVQITSLSKRVIVAEYSGMVIVNGKQIIEIIIVVFKSNKKE